MKHIAIDFSVPLLKLSITMLLPYLLSCAGFGHYSMSFCACYLRLLLYIVIILTPPIYVTIFFFILGWSILPLIFIFCINKFKLVFSVFFMFMQISWLILLLSRCLGLIFYLCGPRLLFLMEPPSCRGILGKLSLLTLKYILCVTIYICNDLLPCIGYIYI